MSHKSSIRLNQKQNLPKQKSLGFFKHDKFVVSLKNKKTTIAIVRNLVILYSDFQQ